MMQFLNSIWLWSSLGILLPIAIHLWNQDPGKILEVGSIRFIDPNTYKQSTKWQLNQIWLLLLRCLLIILLSLFLAKPVWHSGVKPGQKAWIVLPPSSLSVAYQTHQRQIDSLLQLGAEIHAFETGFPKIVLPSKMDPGVANTDTSKPLPNYWQLAKALAKQAPGDHALFVFTPEQMQFYGGIKPVLDRPMTWQTYPLPFKLGEPKNRLKQHLHLALYTKGYQTDAHYLMAALNAIQAISTDTIDYQLYANINQIPSKLDWLFWLSDEPMPTNKAIHSLTYFLGTVVVQPNKIYATASGNAVGIAVQKWVSMPLKGTKIWEDGFGNPVLQMLEKGQYQINTHFHPNWNGLVWNPVFPYWIMNLLLQQTNERLMLPMDANQIIPTYQAPATTTILTGHQTNANHLQIGIWWALLVLLIVERGIVFYQSKNNSHG